MREKENRLPRLRCRLLSSLLLIAHVVGSTTQSFAQEYPSHSVTGSSATGNRDQMPCGDAAPKGSLPDEASIIRRVNAAHRSESAPQLRNAGNAVLKALYDNTATRDQKAPLPMTGIPGGLLSRVYPYAIATGTSTSPGDSYVSYAFQYQTYVNGKYPIAMKGPNAEDVYAWAPGSFATRTPGGLDPVSTGTLFLADLGHGLLLLEQDGGARAPMNPASFYQRMYLGKTYLQHAEDALHWLVNPRNVELAMTDRSTSNRTLRYAAAYILLGKALANVGDDKDGCSAISQGASLLQNALSMGRACSDATYETFPESPNQYAPTCSQFDSSYQNVSVLYLLWILSATPSEGLRSPNGVVTPPAEVFSAVVRAMNRESVAVNFLLPAGGTHSPVPPWCYPGHGSFGPGEISECGNSRVPGGSCNAKSFDAISATLAFQEYAQLASSGILQSELFTPARTGDATAWISIADQVGAWYTGDYRGSSNCTSDPFQPFYL